MYKLLLFCNFNCAFSKFYNSVYLYPIFRFDMPPGLSPFTLHLLAYGHMVHLVKG